MWQHWERRAVPAKQKKTSTNEKTKSQKYTNKQENQIINTQTNKTINLGKQTQPSCVNNGSMYNRVKSMALRWLWEVGICSK